MNQNLTLISYKKIIALLITVVFFVLNSAPSFAFDDSFPAADLYGIQQGGGFQNLPTTEIDSDLTDIKSMGAKWFRMDINWADIQDGGPTSFNWAKYDYVLSAANAKGIKVLGIIDYTPSWARAPGTTDKYPPTNSADYVAFAQAAVARYSVAPYNVKNWEIWNEPNNSSFWSPTANAIDYTNLLKLTYTAIKQIDPTATVLTGGMSPAADGGTDISPRTFLTQIYQSGGQGFFDAVAHHPYTFPYNPSNDPTVGGGDPNWSAWYIMANSAPSLRSIMVANGDTNKKIWATEWGAPTGGGTASVTESVQNSQLKEAFTLFASYPWAGPLIVYKYHDDCSDPANYDCWHGLTRFNGTKKTAYTTFKTLATDTQVPSLSITSPTNNGSVSVNKVTNIQATATDNGAILRTEFRVNGVLKCTDTVAPFSCVWTVPSQRNIHYSIEVKALDLKRNTTTKTISVTSK